MKEDDQGNTPEGPTASENKLQDKPTNVTVNYGKGGPVLANMPSRFQIAAIVLFIGCLYPVYKHIMTMEMKITSLEEDNIRLKAHLASVTEVSQNNRKLFDMTVGSNDKMDLFMKDFYKNYTVTYTLTDKLNSSTKFLLDFTNALNETLLKIKDELDGQITSINDRFEKTEICQSGYEVGAHQWPAQSFPLEHTVEFDPPFKKVPVLSYGLTLLDSTSHLSVELHLLSLTKESFKIRFNTWGEYALYGARFSWIACPK